MQNSFNAIDLESDNYTSLINDYNDLYSRTFSVIVKLTTEVEAIISSYYPDKNGELKPEDDCPKENILLISEVDKKVVLPYTMDNIMKTLEEDISSYDTIQDVIDKKYTKPLNYYKHSSLARFKEAFKLVRERQNGTFFEALDLALELFSNYNLHPAVISACKDLNELDIYLSCLEYNELDDFHFFKTIFKINPSSIKAIKA